jgi:hypothetical protein
MIGNIGPILRNEGEKIKEKYGVNPETAKNNSYFWLPHSEYICHPENFARVHYY